jgi:GNAT superfamily N-acetyltransferase
MIRDAMPRDAADLALVHVTSWQSAYQGLIDQAFLDAMSVESRIERWDALLGHVRGRVLVTEVAGVAVGFCSLGPADHEEWGEVYALYLAPEHWGMGLGRGLLQAGEKALAEDGHDRALLWVLETNPRARAFYERQGWALGKPIRIENIGGADVTEVRYERSLREL